MLAIFLAILVVPFYVVSPVQIDIETDKPVFVIPRRYLSVASSPKTPCADHEDFQSILDSEKFASLLKGLSPAYWRVGGQEAQRVTFHATQRECEDGNFANNRLSLCLTRDIWDKMYGLAVKTNTSLLYDLNDMERLKDGSWNYSNVWQLLNYTVGQGYNVTWQLGNEPSSYFHNFNITVEPEQLVEDNKILRQLVGPKQFVVGPDCRNPDQQDDFQSKMPSGPYLEQWVDKGGPKFVDALSWHQYYIKDPNPTVDQMYSPGMLDQLLFSIQKLQSLTKGNSLDYWLTETGNTIGIDAVHNMSGSYVAGFMWLYKLGLAARMGHSVVCHETLFSSDRGLVDPTDFTPMPSYWISYLFKHLVGRGVLDVHGQLDSNQTVRIFAFCSHPNDSAVNKSYMEGDITLIVINLETTKDAEIQLPESLSQVAVDVYHLTPGIGGITSNVTLLNGNKLETKDATQLPLISPMELSKSQSLSLPPLTYGFYVIRNAKAAACLQVT